MAKPISTLKIKNMQFVVDIVKALTLEGYTVQVRTIYKEYPYENRILHHILTIVEEDPDVPEGDWTVRDKEPL